LDPLQANPRKRWGQNFLINKDALNSIYSSIPWNSLDKNDLIIEIGAGLGNLSSTFHSISQKKVLLEIDPSLIQHLSSNFPDATVIEGDACSTILSFKDQSVYLVGNLPYQITSELIELSLETMVRSKGFVYLVQKEFASRLQEISSISVFIRLFGSIESLTVFGPSLFYPQPRIHSQLIRFTPKHPNLFSLDEIHRSSKVLRAWFWGKRKRIDSSTKESPFLKDDPILQLKVKTSLEAVGISGGIRPDNLSFEDYHHFFLHLNDKISR
jgi:16S rRNA (adenine1518-N6/adenine1519-N6)-dimethyltransferase